MRRRMFAAASYVVSDHLRVQRNFCAERVRQVVGGKPITHRAIGPIERRRADELLSLRGCTTPPGPGLAPKDRGWAGLKDSRQCAGRWCGGGAHGSDRCSKLRGAAQPEQTNTPSIGRPSVCRPGRRPAANDSPSQRNGPQDLFREKSATLELRRRGSVGY